MKAWHATRKFWLEMAALLGCGCSGIRHRCAGAGAGCVTPRAGLAAMLALFAAADHPVRSTSGEGEPHNPATPPDNLSNRLAQSDGVICPPPAVDPEMRLPTPETGRTPVIPPPGSPGGDPSIRPK